MTPPRASKAVELRQVSVPVVAVLAALVVVLGSAVTVTVTIVSQFGELRGQVAANTSAVTALTERIATTVDGRVVAVEDRLRALELLQSRAAASIDAHLARHPDALIREELGDIREQIRDLQAAP